MKMVYYKCQLNAKEGSNGGIEEQKNKTCRKQIEK